VILGRLVDSRRDRQAGVGDGRNSWGRKFKAVMAIEIARGQRMQPVDWRRRTSGYRLVVPDAMAVPIPEGSDEARGGNLSPSPLTSIGSAGANEVVVEQTGHLNGVEGA